MRSFEPQNTEQGTPNAEVTDAGAEEKPFDIRSSLLDILRINPLTPHRQTQSQLMHELSLATALVEQVQRVCAAEKASAVESIRLRLGALSGVDRESFEFSFPLVADETCAAGAKLVFDEVPAEITCDACGKCSSPKKMFLQCSACGSTHVRITAGREFQIVSVELRTEEQAVG